MQQAASSTGICVFCGVHHTEFSICHVNYSVRPEPCYLYRCVWNDAVNIFLVLSCNPVQALCRRHQQCWEDAPAELPPMPAVLQSPGAELLQMKLAASSSLLPLSVTSISVWWAAVQSWDWLWGHLHLTCRHHRHSPSSETTPGAPPDHLESQLRAESLFLPSPEFVSLLTCATKFIFQCCCPSCCWL